MSRIRAKEYTRMTVTPLRVRQLALLFSLAATSVACDTCGGCGAPPPKDKPKPPATRPDARAPEPEPVTTTTSAADTQSATTAAVTETPEAAKPEASTEAAKPDPTANALADTLLGRNRKKPVSVVRSGPRPQRQRPARTRPRPVDRRPADEPDEPEESVEEDVPVEEEIPGTLSDSRFHAVVHSWRGVKNCLKTTAIRGELKNGAVSVAFTIRPDGTVKTSKIQSTSNDTARQVAPCIRRQAAKIRFPAFSGGDPVNKEAKFVF